MNRREFSNSVKQGDMFWVVFYRDDKPYHLLLHRVSRVLRTKICANVLNSKLEMGTSVEFSNQDPSLSRWAITRPEEYYLKDDEAMVPIMNEVTQRKLKGRLHRFIAEQCPDQFDEEMTTAIMEWVGRMERSKPEKETT